MSELNNLDVVGLMQEHEAILNGHFQLPSGFHSQSYVQTALLMQYPHIAQKVASALAAKFPGAVDVVLAPTAKIAIIAQEVARVKKARAIFAEKTGNGLLLKRNFKIEEGEKVLVVDDVITTGNLTGTAVVLAQRYGAKVVGVAAIVDRSTSDLPLNVPMRALLSYPLQVYPPDKCPLCKDGIPLSIPGSPLKPIEFPDAE
ncbi:MAG: orotate phosphoribosyltransferase [Elusimicrobiaceae bacterium]|jgi:orotate phosphoribosyltransferase